MNPDRDKKEKVLGILGGMGPAATLNFYAKVLKFSRARQDQEHLQVIIDCNCKIPDRTVSLRTNHLSPVLERLKESAHRLVQAGAEIIAVPCVTAHAWFPELQQFCPVELLNIVRETRRVFQRSGYKHPALLASAGTISAGLYQREFAGFDLMLPEPQQIEGIHAAIMQIKGGYLSKARPVISAAVSTCRQRGADSVLLGCTDIPLVLNHNKFPLPIFDGTEILAQTAVSRCRK